MFANLIVRIERGSGLRPSHSLYQQTSYLAPNLKTCHISVIEIMITEVVTIIIGILLCCCWESVKSNNVRISIGHETAMEKNG